MQVLSLISRRKVGVLCNSAVRLFVCRLSAMGAGKVQ